MSRQAIVISRALIASRVKSYNENLATLAEAKEALEQNPSPTMKKFIQAAHDSASETVEKDRNYLANRIIQLISENSTGIDGLLNTLNTLMDAYGTPEYLPGQKEAIEAK